VQRKSQCPLYPNSGRHRPIKVVSEILRLPLLGGALAERLGLRQELCRISSIMKLVKLHLDVYRAFREIF
jgi:hypothetical protein